MYNYYELAIIAFILVGIGYVLWKGGAANPVSTGGLKTKLTTLDGDVRELKTKVGAVATRVEEFEQRAATKGDIERIETRLADWERKLDKIETLDERLDALTLELAKVQQVAANSHLVIESTAEGLRATNQCLQAIDRRAEATAAITGQVPGFIEKILERQASNTSRIDAIGAQVDRLYHFLTEKALK